MKEPRIDGRIELLKEIDRTGKTGPGVKRTGYTACTLAGG